MQWSEDVQANHKSRRVGRSVARAWSDQHAGDFLPTIRPGSLGQRAVQGSIGRVRRRQTGGRYAHGRDQANGFAGHRRVGAGETSAHGSRGQPLGRQGVFRPPLAQGSRMAAAVPSTRLVVEPRSCGAAARAAAYGHIPKAVGPPFRRQRYEEYEECHLQCFWRPARLASVLSGCPHPASWMQDPSCSCGGVYRARAGVVPVEVEGQYTFIHPCGWQPPIQRH